MVALAQTEVNFPVVLPPEMLARTDDFEKFIASMPPTELPLTARFVRLLMRTIRMPRGTVVTTKIHAKRHTFDIVQGRVAVWMHGKGWERYQAPYSGVTEPGTKRVIIVEEDCIWNTYHETDAATLAEAEAELIIPHNNPLLNPEERNRLINSSQ